MTEGAAVVDVPGVELWELPLLVSRRWPSIDSTALVTELVAKGEPGPGVSPPPLFTKAPANTAPLMP